MVRQIWIVIFCLSAFLPSGSWALGPRCYKRLVGLLSIFHRPLTLQQTIEKYSSHYQAIPENKYEAIDTLGIELEGAVKDRESLYIVRDVIAKELATTLPGVESYSVEGSPDDLYAPSYPQIRYKKDGESFFWVFYGDESVKPLPGWQSAEIAAPPLNSKKERAQFFHLLPKIEKSGLRPVPESGGVHFHIGFSNAQPAEAALLVLAFSKVERDLFRVMGILPSRRKFTELIRTPILNRLFAGNVNIRSLESLIEDLSPTVDRYGPGARHTMINS